LFILTVVTALSEDVDGATVVVDTDWIVNTTDNLNESDTDFRISANLTISGQITFKRCKLIFLCDTPGQYGITVQPGGYLTASVVDFEAGELSPGNPGKPWTFFVKSAGRLFLQRCELRGMGVMGGGETKRGLAIQSDNARVTDSTFIDNNRGILVMDSAAPSIEDNTFEANQVGIEVTGSTFNMDLNNNFRDNGFGLLFVDTANGYVRGSTFTDNSYGVRAVLSNVILEGVAIDGLGRGVLAEVDSWIAVKNATIKPIDKRAHAKIRSHVVFRDCDADGFEGMTMTEDTSTIKVINSVQLKVAYEGADSPVVDVTVELYDAKGTKTNQMVTDTDGLTSVQEVLMYEHERGLQPEVHAPFMIVASEGYNYLEVPDYYPGPNDFTLIYFVDDFQPDLVVLLPTNGAIYNSTDVMVRGRVSDKHSGLANFTYTVNGGDPNPLIIQDPWELTVTLPEGVLTLVFMAEDLVGNSVTVSRDIEVDVSAPTIEEIDPPHGSVTRAFQLMVTGLTEAGATISLDGDPLEVAENGSFTDFITLGDSDGEEVLTFLLTDKAGNSATFKYTIIVDRQPPALTVETSPDYRDFPILNTSQVLFFGTCEPGAIIQIRMGGQVVNETTSDTEGKWRIVVELEIGENDPIVDAFDGAGNRESVEIIDFLLDQTPPEITILQPINGTITRKSEILVEVRTDPESLIWVNDLPEMTMPAHGEVEFIVPLPFVGENPIIVYSRDQAGNLHNESIYIVREKKKGGGGDDSPGPGPDLTIIALVAAGAVSLAVNRWRRRTI
jgi:parallel beta-helix repeat protein